MPICDLSNFRERLNHTNKQLNVNMLGSMRKERQAFSFPLRLRKCNRYIRMCDVNKRRQQPLNIARANPLLLENLRQALWFSFVKRAIRNSVLRVVRNRINELEEIEADLQPELPVQLTLPVVQNQRACGFLNRIASHYVPSARLARTAGLVSQTNKSCQETASRSFANRTTHVYSNMIVQFVLLFGAVDYEIGEHAGG